MFILRRAFGIHMCGKDGKDKKNWQREKLSSHSGPTTAPADPLGSSRARLACLNCLALDGDGLAFILLPPQESGKGFWLLLQEKGGRQSLKGLRAEGTCQRTWIISDNSPSLKGKLFHTFLHPLQSSTFMDKCLIFEGTYASSSNILLALGISQFVTIQSFPSCWLLSCFYFS